MNKVHHLSGDNVIAIDTYRQGTLLSELAAIIKKRRKALNISPLELAARCKLPAADVVALEQGEWDVDVLALIAISLALETNLTSLMTVLEQRLTAASTVQV